VGTASLLIAQFGGRILSDAEALDHELINGRSARSFPVM
jgi:hypothetical protein